MPILAKNKRAYLDFEVLETYEAGPVLKGYETKAVKNGQIKLKGSYIDIKYNSKDKPELFLVNAHISKYKYAGDIGDYDPTRSRKLLLRKKQVEYLLGKKREKGLTLIPLKVYTKRSLVKLEFALARGRRKVDKRDVIKKREEERRIRTLTKRNRIRY
jgi:SsrA-binding protein